MLSFILVGRLRRLLLFYIEPISRKAVLTEMLHQLGFSAYFAGGDILQGSKILGCVSTALPAMWNFFLRDC